MPIFFQRELDSATKLGDWRIEEDDAFFRRQVEPQRRVSHPHKNLQHLAGRYLLQHLFADFPTSLIRVADTRKPFLEDEAFHFSISHCADFAAAIVSRDRRVGVDIEVPSDKVERIRHKFLSEEDEAVLGRFEEQLSEEEKFAIFNTQYSGHNELQAASYKPQANSPLSLVHSPFLTLLWSCKEAVFKWYGLGQVDSKKHIVLRTLSAGAGSVITTALFCKEAPVELRLHSMFFGASCLSYVCTPPGTGAFFP